MLNRGEDAFTFASTVFILRFSSVVEVLTQVNLIVLRNTLFLMATFDYAA